MMDRKLSLLSKSTEQLLIKQLAHELKNRNLYLSFANFFANEGISDLEEYYRLRAEEENNHHQWIMDYLSDADCQFIYPSIELNTEKFSTLIDPFILTIDREILTTEMIYSIYGSCQNEKDYMTCSWLYEKLIKEQIEEENTSRMARDIMEQENASIFNKAKKVLKLLK